MKGKGWVKKVTDHEGVLKDRSKKRGNFNSIKGGDEGKVTKGT